MKRLIPLLIGIVLFIACKKEKTDEEKIEELLRNEGFFSALSAKIGWTYTAAKGDTAIPSSVERKVHGPEVDYTINITDRTAEIPITIKWYDTLVITYPQDTLTYRKPAPLFTGTTKFYYKVEEGAWKLYKITPLDIKSDSGPAYVKIDSIQIIKNGTPLPTITTPTMEIDVPTYPYVFKVGDTVEVRLFETSNAKRRFGLLHPHGGNSTRLFTYDTTGNYWYVRCYLQTAGKHWCFAELMDLYVVIVKSVPTERNVLWAIPYKIE